MLVYLSAPYSSIQDKCTLMNAIMKASGEYMVQHPGEFVVTPLANHFSLEHVPDLGTDWEFWKDYSTALMEKCGKVIVLTIPGWGRSTGVDAEINLATDLGIPVDFL
jgi:hypothetical protein